MKTITYWLIILLSTGVTSCKRQLDLKLTSTFDTKGALNAIIEIPAGTNKKIEYNSIASAFKTDQRNGKDRIVNFLPYPANYGFIPSTLSDVKKGGDGDPIDILVVTESQPTGTLLQVVPLAMLKLIDNGEEDFKVLAIPIDQKLNVLGITSFEALRTKYPALLQILETWFLNYDSEPAKSLGWANQQETLEYIKKNLKTSK